MNFEFGISNKGQEKTFQVPAYPDTASSRSVVSLSSAKAIGAKIKPTNDTLYNASNEEMIVNGKIKCDISVDGKHKVKMDALVSEDLDSETDPINLISWHDLENLKLIKISQHKTKNKEIFETTSNFKTECAMAVTHASYATDFPPLPKPRPKPIPIKAKPKQALDSVDIEKMTCSEIMNLLKKEYSDVITNKLPEMPMKGDPYVIEINEEKAKAFPPRPATAIKAWPLHMEDACRRVLKNLEEDGVIRKLGPQEKAPYLAHSLFVSKKDPNADPRLVVNHDRLNLNSDRPVHPINSPQSLIQRVKHDSKFWLAADCLSGYHQHAIAEESQPLTAFLTPIGRYCFRRLSMGISLASDVFNIQTDLAFEPLMETSFGLLKCVDDVAFSSSSKTGLYKKAKQFFDFCRKYNIAISEKKLQVSRKISFVGYEIDGGNVSMDKSKINAVMEFPCPSTISQVRSWIGLVQTFSRHHCDLAMATEPMRQLLKKKNAFQVTPEIMKSFEETKEILCSSPILAPFDKSRKTFLTSDCSLDGKGYILFQQDKKIKDKYYLIKAGSCANTDAQRNYGVGELELEGIRWALSDCNFLLRGMKKSMLTVFTDHKSLPEVFKKQVHLLPTARYIRCRLDTQKYDFNIKYTPATSKIMMASDLMSRRIKWDGFNEYSSEDNCDIENFATSNIALLTHHCPAAAKSEENVVVDDVTPLFLQNLAKATLDDPQLQILSNAIKNKTKFDDIDENDQLYAYKKEYDRLSVNKDNLILLDGTRILVPKSQRPEVLRSLHLGHSGHSKMKALCNEFYFWKNQNESVSELISSCDICQMYMRSNPTQKIHPEFDNPSEVYAMSHISSDILQVDQTNIIVTRDRFSGFIMANKLQSTTSQAIRDALHACCLTYGFPTVCQVDGGRNYQGEIVKAWADKYGIKLTTTSSYWSRSNGLVENANSTVRKLFLKSKSYEDFKLRLLEFNNLPRTDSDFTPSQLFIGRRMRTSVAALSAHFAEGSNQEVYSKRIEKKAAHYKRYGGGKELKDFEIDDVVRIQDKFSKKWDKFGIVKEKIRGKSGQSSSYKILIGDTYYHRNKQYLRKTKSLRNEKSASCATKCDESNNDANKALKKNADNKKPGILLPAKMIIEDGFIFGAADLSASARKGRRRSSRNKKVHWSKMIAMQQSSKPSS